MGGEQGQEGEKGEKRIKRRRRKAFVVNLDQCLFLSHSQHTCLLNWLGMVDVSNF